MILATRSPEAVVAGDHPATVVALVAHARWVPSLRREAFAAELAALEPSPGAIVVHTCHRVELYIAPGAWGDRPLPALPDGGRRLEDVEAARHLIEVACGLDSAVLGEDQILHQLRETIAARHAELPLDPILDRLFQAALHAGRRAHTWYGGSPRSLADLALDEIARRIGPLEGRPILIGGVGRMGRLAALATARRGARLVITNRTEDRARALANELDGTTIPFGVDDALPPIDGAIVALGGTWPVGPSDTERLLAGHAVIVDLSSPPAVAADLQARLGSRFVSVDDLAGGPVSEPDDRLTPAAPGPHLGYRPRLLPVAPDPGRGPGHPGHGRHRRAPSPGGARLAAASAGRPARGRPTAHRADEPSPGGRASFTRRSPPSTPTRAGSWSAPPATSSRYECGASPPPRHPGQRPGDDPVRARRRRPASARCPGRAGHDPDPGRPAPARHHLGRGRVRGRPRDRPPVGGGRPRRPQRQGRPDHRGSPARHRRLPGARGSARRARRSGVRAHPRGPPAGEPGRHRQPPPRRVPPGPSPGPQGPSAPRQRGHPATPPRRRRDRRPHPRRRRAHPARPGGPDRPAPAARDRPAGARPGVARHPVPGRRSDHPGLARPARRSGDPQRRRDRAGLPPRQRRWLPGADRRPGPGRPGPDRPDRRVRRHRGAGRPGRHGRSTDRGLGRDPRPDRRPGRAGGRAGRPSQRGARRDPAVDPPHRAGAGPRHPNGRPGRTAGRRAARRRSRGARDPHDRDGPCLGGGSTRHGRRRPRAVRLGRGDEPERRRVDPRGRRPGRRGD